MPRIALVVPVAVALGWASIAHADPLEPRAQNVIVRHEGRSEVPTLGPRHAPVTIDFFLNLRSRHSLTLHKNLLELAKRHPRRVRIIYRFLVDRDRSRMAEAAMEAFAQGRFMPFMRELVREPDVRLPQRKKSLAKACKRAGVDFGRIEAAWASRLHRPILEKNAAYRYQRHVRLVPSLLINGQPPRSPRVQRLRLGDLEAAYDAAYVVAKHIVANGVPVEQIYALSLRRIDAERAHAPPRIRAVDGVHASEMRGPIYDAPLLRMSNLGPGHEIGPESAQVKLLFYCNFASPHCAELERFIRQASQSYPRELSLMFYPMFSESLEGEALRDVLMIHRASLCAEEQGAFWRFYDAAFGTLQDRRHRSSRILPAADHLEAIFRRLEVDSESYESCMARDEWDEVVMERVRAGRKAGVQHSPSVVIGGRIYPGLKLVSELRALIEQELAPGLLEQFAPSWPRPSFDRESL